MIKIEVISNDMHICTALLENIVKAKTHKTNLENQKLKNDYMPKGQRNVLVKKKIKQLN